MAASLLEGIVAGSDADEVFKALSPCERQRLMHLWPAWARPEQLSPPGDWRTWLILSGRGWGKTRTAAEWSRQQVETRRCGRMALVAATAADARDVLVEGESGILAISPPWCRPLYEPSKRRLTWPNGAQATTYSADEPDRLRGPQHDGAWADELAAWKYPETWDMLMFGLRLGADPRAVVATTPRPTRIIRDLIAASTTVVTRGSTFDNRSNLAPAFLDQITRKYEGTRLGRQELYAEVLDDSPGALWKRDRIEELRRRAEPEFRRVVVAIDPAVSSSEDSDETGIVTVGVALCKCRGSEELHGFVLDDLSGRHTPNAWAVAAVSAYRKRKADRIVAEVNNGGALVEVNLRTVDTTVSYRGVHAAQGKRTRAEPVAALYEQGKVHHVGMLAGLEDQMCTWDPLAGEKSPDRVDALVWGLTELMLEEAPIRAGSSPATFLDH